MTTYAPQSDFFRCYNLSAAREGMCPKHPAAHQQVAVSKLNEWYDSQLAPLAGGILVLPTGGGKTFTAAHFICRRPLSEGYKILWLAHTHHLLEQAYACLDGLVGQVAEPRTELRARVVSGTTGHFKVGHIKPTDDVLVATLQTIWRAVQNDHPLLNDFISSADGKLFVVVDEAHHSPAPSYRQLIENLRARCAQFHLLGLTATPTYTDVNKRGWLAKLFPQGILYQISPKELMIHRVLAQPVFEDARTEFAAEFNERDYEKWRDTNQDLPEEIVSHLAMNQRRNDFIVGCYVSNRQKYGKTLIFADRWYQCEYICEALRNRDVRADVVFSHVDADSGSVAARNRRTASENALVLRRFKNGELDVLLNVRMLTEGTDVPDVQTVFLTRQTTSLILLTQMVGRALRGVQFGGTEKAFIVSFIDNWKQRVNWADYAQIDGGTNSGVPRPVTRPPLDLISIDLVKRLARQIDSGVNVAPGPFLTLLPLGWYWVEFQATQAPGSDELESVNRLVMVFEHEEDAFRRYIGLLKTTDLDGLCGEDVRLDGEIRSQIDRWQGDIFFGAGEHFGSDILRDLFDIARHMAQNENRPPAFVPFEARNLYDLDQVARQFMRLDRYAEGPALRAEYGRPDRHWRILYYNYDLFKSQYDACVNRILNEGAGPAPATALIAGEAVPAGELTEGEKEEIKKQDGYRCLCCGCTRKSLLQVDHITPSYFGPNNAWSNLQTLCKTCNRAKNIRSMNFRNKQTTLGASPSSFPVLDTPPCHKAGDADCWKEFVQRSINFFYQCAAVHEVEIGQRGERARNWLVTLNFGNDTAWAQQHLPALALRIRQIREAGHASSIPLSISVR